MGTWGLLGQREKALGSRSSFEKCCLCVKTVVEGDVGSRDTMVSATQLPWGLGSCKHKMV